MSSPLLDAIRRQAGRGDTPPPRETPDQYGPVTPSDQPRVRKRTREIDDDLTDAVRAVNDQLEKILESGGEIPDDAVPELQRMAQLQVKLVEASNPGQGSPASQNLPML